MVSFQVLDVLHGTVVNGDWTPPCVSLCSIRSSQPTLLLRLPATIISSSYILNFHYLKLDLADYEHYFHVICPALYIKPNQAWEFSSDACSEKKYINGGV
jgi:hypothetical protein